MSRAAAVFTTLAGLLLATAAPAAAQDFGSRQPGVHVYDRVGALTPAQVADLEQRAGRLDQAGAPTVVYLRGADETPAATRQDARDLMDAWQVESSPGAKDGLVLFVNLRPDGSRHGSAVLYAGAAHARDGSLTDGRLQAIYDGRMRPRLEAGDLGEGLAAGLDGAREDLDAPRTAQAARQPGGSAWSEDLVGWLVAAGLGLLGAGGLLFVAWRVLPWAHVGHPASVQRAELGDGSLGGWADSGGSSFGGDGGAGAGGSSGGGNF